VGFVIYAGILIMYICFRIVWELAELLIKMIILLVTLCFGRPTWARF
jgi:hypothetical protein